MLPRNSFSLQEAVFDGAIERVSCVGKGNNLPFVRIDPFPKFLVN